MGRTEPSRPLLAPQSHRKDQRAKHARLTINKTIPALLKTNYRARQGILEAELIVDPPAAPSIKGSSHQEVPKPESDIKGSSGSKKKRGKKSRDLERDAEEHVPTQAPSGKKSKSDDDGPLIYKIQVSDTLQAAQKLHSQLPKKPKIPNQNIALLNMASPLRPGGGVLNGATSQEEFLCTRTTLLPTLREEWYRLPEVGGAWSPDVCVFRVPKIEGGDLELGRRDRFFVDVISAGMLRFPEVVEKPIGSPAGSADGTEEDEDLVETEKVYANEADRELVLKKIRGVMRILQTKGAERVVLGAWGCGAYGNPVRDIALLWKKVLLGKARKGQKKDPVVLGSEWKPLKEIVFAIKDRKLADEFAEAWGSDIVVEYGPERESAPTTGRNEVDEQNLEELTEKIRGLELDLGQAKSPLLRQALENTLASLHAQMEEIGQDSGSMDASLSDDGTDLAGDISDGEGDGENEDEDNFEEVDVSEDGDGQDENDDFE
ncbi:tigr02452 family protein [Venturia nashicola]|uniref:Tigr02452 family protein n=1 Tax=Venturia nashicola TaxID=86259 RepID=A0A4Z1PCP6_9PEZI|nr:tigr02452 family protein [Venturia nashicola]TLD29574.1 tigr02452 family protein [Venturia nashicola]